MCLVSGVCCVLTCNVGLDSCLLESHSCRLAGREPKDWEGGGGGETEEHHQTLQQGQRDHPPPSEASVLSCSSQDGHCRTDRGCSMFDIVRPRLQLIHINITHFSSIMKSNLSVWERLARSCSFLDERAEIIVDGGRKMLTFHVRHQLTGCQGFSPELPTLLGYDLISGRLLRDYDSVILYKWDQ